VYDIVLVCGWWLCLWYGPAVFCCLCGGPSICLGDWCYAMYGMFVVLGWSIAGVCVQEGVDDKNLL